MHWRGLWRRCRKPPSLHIPWIWSPGDICVALPLPPFAVHHILLNQLVPCFLSNVDPILAPSRCALLLFWLSRRVVSFHQFCGGPPELVLQLDFLAIVGRQLHRVVCRSPDLLLISSAASCSLSSLVAHDLSLPLFQFVRPSPLADAPRSPVPPVPCCISHLLRPTACSTQFDSC